MDNNIFIKEIPCSAIWPPFLAKSTPLIASVVSQGHNPVVFKILRLDCMEAISSLLQSSQKQTGTA